MAELLDAAQSGESIAVTRRGVVVACLGPPSFAKRGLPDLTDFRASLHSEGVPLSEIVVRQRQAERY